MRRISGNALLVLSVSMLSIAASVVYLLAGLSTIYNDAMSHLDIARLVFDNEEPGFSQLGSVWLPLSHILNLAFVWNNTLWHTGLAGSIISMIAFVVSTVGIWKIVLELTSNKLAAFVAAAAFALNLNMLYLQSTPLTEPLYVMLLVLSCLFMVKYLKSGKSIYILPLSLFTALQMLTRYDGWFVAVIEGLIIIAYEYICNRRSLRVVAGNFTLFATPVAFSALLWFGWNWLIFHDPLYFILGPYSAHAQQAALEHSGGLITKGSLLISSKAYMWDMIDNIGIYVVITGIIGWFAWLLKSRTFSKNIKVFIFSMIISVVIFNILALILGFSIINVPELHWNPSGRAEGNLFNVRYGVMALPFISVGFGLLAVYLKKASFLLIMLILCQSFLIFKTGIITIQDGKYGSSSFANRDLANIIKGDVGQKDKVLMSTSYFNAVAFSSSLDLKQYIHEGVSRQWSEAKSHPDKYVKWIVTANGDVGEPVYTSLVKNEHNAFLANYKLVYAGAHANLYEKKTSKETFATVTGHTIQIGTEELKLKGFNSYDLAYRSDKEIDATFNALKVNHVNTIRFWAFGDGQSNGFQPASGIINPDRMKAMDYILAEANRYGMRVIPVLVNNWEDYGGAKQYLKWAGLKTENTDAFFNDPQEISLFENYVNHILTRHNQATGVAYADDPAILAWELMNEPRVTKGHEYNIKLWTDKIGTYMHEHDGNHLTTIGTDKDLTDVIGSDLCKSAKIDFCSVHIYLEDKGKGYYADLSQVDATLLKYKDGAVQVNKPIIIGEIGVSKATRPYGNKPVDVLEHLLRQSEKDDYSGWLIWNWALTPDSSFGFSANKGDFGLETVRALLAQPRY